MDLYRLSACYRILPILGKKKTVTQNRKGRGFTEYKHQQKFKTNLNLTPLAGASHKEFVYWRIYSLQSIDIYKVNSEL